MSGVGPTIIDYQGIKVEKPNLEKSVTLTMDSSNQGFILDYDKLTDNPKKFTITDNGINFTDTSNNNITTLDRLSLVQSLFQAVEVPSNSTTLQINNKLLLDNSANSVTASLALDDDGNLTIDACGNLILKSGNTTRLTIDNNGTWIVQGGMSYNNATNNLTATTFTGTATQIDISDNNTDVIYYPVFVSGISGRVPFIDINTGPLTYNPNTGVMNFPGVPTCDISANTTNQLLRWQNFGPSTSFTPQLISSGGGTIIDASYNSRSHNYIQVGKLCIGIGEIRTTSITGLNAGDLSITIPVQCSNNVTGSFVITLMNGMSTSPNIIQFGMIADKGDSAARLICRDTATSSTYRNLTKNDITNVFRIRYNYAYFTS